MLKKSSRFAMLFAPIVSMCVLTLGNTFYTTYTTLELERTGQGNGLIGLVSAVYFTGMVIGSYLTQKPILRIGYIRAYVLFATLMAVGSLLQGMFYSAWLWVIFRFICGYALAGLFIVVESWCLEGAGDNFKGRVLSVYLLLYYFAQAIGQYLLKVNYSSALFAFCVISILASLSTIPVSLTRFNMPKKNEIELLSPKILFKKAPLGIWAALASGVILGSIYTIYPLFLKQNHYPAGTVATMMFAIILGGMILQIPIGRFSDLIDRRKVLLSVLIAAFVIAILICLLNDSFYEMLLLSFLLGGVTFAIYPISISHASDYLSPEKLVGVVGLLALAYGFGSMLGPLFVTGSMSVFGPFGFFIFIAAVCLVLIVYTIWRIYICTEIPSEAEKVQFQQMSPEASLASEGVYEQQRIDEKTADIETSQSNS